MKNLIALRFKNWSATKEDKQELAIEIATSYIEDLGYNSLKDYIETNFGTDEDSKQEFKEDVKWFINKYENDTYKNNNIDLDFFNNEFGYKQVKSAMTKLFK